ncbi:RHS repeat domain-containing protein [Emticicia sp. TH156]|uniref:RHS repeat domain-containing protein n=1 Tax=Emticicia sp. TH156 TaxID=2067454 RepID=UPI0013046B07|nr:RHS repeat-associated core domain-containing protein [Emticicia sp. TH156]
MINEKGLSEPIEIQLTNNRWIKNFYDGSGCLYKTTYSTGEYWEYLDGLVFKNGAFYQLATPEGRANYQSGAWSYEYFITDHLGNTHVAYKANGTALTKTSETAFDPWGVVLKDAGLVNTFQSRFEFLNREKESTFNLNLIRLGARGYNPTIRRFDRVDPVVAEQEEYSTYQYGWNNPVLRSDPDGNLPVLPWLDAVVDVAFVVYDAGVLVHEKLTTGKTSKENWAALAADGLSIAVPMSVGAGMAVKAGMKAANKVDNAADAGNAMQKLKKSAETGQEAHRQIQKGLKEKGADIEVPMKLKDGTNVRKDAVKPDGTAFIIKPNTKSGQKSAAKREKLMRDNGHKTEKAFYDPKDPKYQPSSPTYIGPKKQN